MYQGSLDTTRAPTTPTMFQRRNTPMTPTTSNSPSPCSSTSSSPTDSPNGEGIWRIPTLLDMCINKIFLEREGHDLLSRGDDLSCSLPIEVAKKAFARLCATRTLKPHIMRCFAQTYGANFFIEIEIIDCPNFCNLAMETIGATLSLARLSLVNCSGFNDNGLQYLGHISTLEELDLSRCSGITDSSFRKLSTLVNLKKLNLENTNIGDDGVGFIAGFEALQWLSLSQTKVTDIGLQVLTRGLITPRCKSLSRLQTLYLRGTRLTDRIISSLASFPSIIFIDLKGSEVSPFGIGKLRGLLEKKPTVKNVKVVIQTIAVILEEPQKHFEEEKQNDLDSFQATQLSPLISYLRAPNRYNSRNRRLSDPPSTPLTSRGDYVFGSRIGDFPEDLTPVSTPTPNVSSAPVDRCRPGGFSYSTPKPSPVPFRNTQRPPVVTPSFSRIEAGVTDDFDFPDSPVKKKPLSSNIVKSKPLPQGSIPMRAGRKLKDLKDISSYPACSSFEDAILPLFSDPQLTEKEKETKQQGTQSLKALPSSPSRLTSPQVQSPKSPLKQTTLLSLGVTRLASSPSTQLQSSPINSSSVSSDSTNSGPRLEVAQQPELLSSPLKQKLQPLPSSSQSPLKARAAIVDSFPIFIARSPVAPAPSSPLLKYFPPSPPIPKTPSSSASSSPTSPLAQVCFIPLLNDTTSPSSSPPSSSTPSAFIASTRKLSSASSFASSVVVPSTSSLSSFFSSVSSASTPTPSIPSVASTPTASFSSFSILGTPAKVSHGSPMARVSPKSYCSLLPSISPPNQRKPVPSPSSSNKRKFSFEQEGNTKENNKRLQRQQGQASSSYSSSSGTKVIVKTRRRRTLDLLNQSHMLLVPPTQPMVVNFASWLQGAR